MSAVTVPISFSSPSAFAVAEMPRSSVLEYERRVRFLVVNGRQDDGLWGPIGALWLSDDGARGGFLVNPYALWNGSEIARSYRSAQARVAAGGDLRLLVRGDLARAVLDRREQGAETLALLADLVNAL